jgi:chemotaxis protein MotB
MVIIFVLLVFVLAQAFLSVALTGRDKALDRVNRQMAELSDMLALERGRTAELQASVARLGRELTVAAVARDGVGQQLTLARGEQLKITAERDALKLERDRLAARLADNDLQLQSAQARNEQLQARLGEAAKRTDAAGQDAAQNAAQAIEARRQIAARERDLADMQRALAAGEARLKALQEQSDALDRTVQADKATIEAKLSDLARMADQVRALTALRDDLERQVRDAAARATTEAQQRAATAALLADEQRLGESARAQIALLNRQMEEMRAQLAQVATALDASEKSAKDKDVQIVNLGSRLNAALAQKVEELQRYRSDFFGRLREVLANRPGIAVVGDRFVFQSEVLFPVGSADLSLAGWEQVKALAATLIEVSRDIPPDVNWVLRVDGHADRQRVQSARFPSNWELSSSRAITVVKLLVAEGVPANRLAATGFGDNQPLDGADTAEAYARNRRIEIRLTDR